MVVIELRFVLITRWRSLGGTLRVVLKRSVVRAAFSILSFAVWVCRIGEENLKGAAQRLASVLSRLWNSL
jgi:hypothetical protein